MTTTQDLRAAFEPEPGFPSGLDPQLVLAAGRRQRRRRRALHVGAVSAAVAVLSMTAVSGVSMTGASDPVAFASQPYVVSDDGRVRVGRITAALSGEEATFSVPRVGRLGVRLEVVRSGDRFWANNLVAVASTEPITRGTIDISGRRFETTVVQFAERPEYRFAVVLLDEGMNFNSGLAATFTGTDDTGNVLVQVDL